MVWYNTYRTLMWSTAHGVPLAANLSDIGWQMSAFLDDAREEVRWNRLYYRYVWTRDVRLLCLT